MYHRMNAWLEREIVTKHVPYFVILAILCAFIAGALGQTLLSLWGIQVSKGNVVDIRQALSFWGFMDLMIPAIVLEELIYRAPLMIVAYLDPPLIIPSILISSALFGWAHGDWTNLFVQGIDGIIFSVVLLKCGGMHNKLVKSALSVTMTHALYNMSVWTLVTLR
ncbi:CPBP family intramembrane metalloprotease [Candidatus Kaiserbacteria bacterium]|nr:CPBP family intramembrane metalloprotease [Candidatus Kaiserbacteria bacterium]